MPVHPMLVHVPLALAITGPILGIAVYLWGRKNPTIGRAWVFLVIWQVLLAGSTYAAMATGETDEERVAELVGKDKIEKHENAATVLLFVSIAGVAIGALAAKKAGIFQPAFIVLQIAALAAALYTGRLGGEIVYVHGGFG